MSLAAIVAKRSLALPASPVIIAFGWFAAMQMEALWSVDWIMGSAQVRTAMLWPTALVAAVAAWDASRMRWAGSDSVERTYPRSGLAHLLIGGLPALLVGLLSSVAAFLAVATSMRGGGTPLWGHLFLSELVLVAAVVVGVACGHVLPRYLAAPTVGIAVWLVAAYGAISDNKYVRGLAVQDVECCSVGQQLQITMLAGQGLWLLGIVVAGGAVLCRWWPRQAYAVGAAAVVAMFCGVLLLQQSNFQLTTVRQPAETVCRTRDEVTACMWPEHAEDLDRWLSAAQRYRALFGDLGPLPDRFTESDTDRSNSAVRIGVIRPGRTDDELVESLALTGLERPPECARVESSQPGVVSYGAYPGMEGRGILTACARHRIQPDLPVGAVAPPGRADEVERLLAASERERSEWVGRARHANQDCDSPMPELP